jgi:hypothetical protein
MIRAAGPDHAQIYQNGTPKFPGTIRAPRAGQKDRLRQSRAI